MVYVHSTDVRRMAQVKILACTYIPLTGGRRFTAAARRFGREQMLDSGQHASRRGGKREGMAAQRTTGSHLQQLPRLLVALLIPTALVAGLLSVPTTCRCGAEHPHTHTIFQLGEHHHHDDNGASDASATRMSAADTPGTHHPPNDDAAQVETPSPTAGSSLVLALLSDSALPGVGDDVPITTRTQPLDGHSRPPLAPPPQL